MTHIKVWKLKSDVPRAVESLLKCADDSTFPNYSDPDRLQDGVDFVRELVQQADRCASSANVNPNGLAMVFKNPIQNDDLIEFKKCFHYSLTGAAPSVQLKLFRAGITKPTMGNIPATVQNHTVLILACTKAEAFVVAVDHDPRYRKWDIELKEVEGPFINGQIIMDFGLRTISTLDDPLLDF